ncbi:MAG: PHB depolymerase family esterase [Saprospiraceae bacterium]|nr:PHB depolymerase family esterase [Saprospiraceae bacterium]
MQILWLFIAGLMLNCSTTPTKIPMTPSTAELEYLIRKPAVDTAGAPVLILLHGFGSNEQDMFSFASRIPENWLVVSARGPVPQGENRHSWYNVKMVNGKITLDFQEEEQSRQKILGLIDHLANTYKVDKNRVVLAGFSQGAAMAQCTGLTKPEKVAGFALFSGRFVEEITPLISRSPDLKKLRSFIAHGSNDTMLPIQYAAENKAKLEQLGIPFVYSEDTTGHTISSKQFTDFLHWLRQF